MRWRFRLRSYLVVLALVALLPVVSFAAVAVVRLAQLERATSEQAMRETARALSLAVDRELAGARSALLFLVVSPRLAAGDLEAFHRQASDALSLRGTAIVLADAAGRELVNTSLPAGARRPQAEEVEVVRNVVDTGRPLISDLLRGSVSGRPLVAVSVPVFERHRVRYVLSMVFSPEALGSILAEQKFSGHAVGAVYDRLGIAIARTGTAAPRAVGAPGPARLVEAMRARPDGWLRETTVDGVRSYFAFSRSKFSGWTVSFAEPAASFDDALHRSLWVVAAGGILATLLGVGLATLVGARISGAIGALSSAAPAVLAGHQRFEAPPSAIAEIDDLATALESTRETMLRQSQDIVTTNRRLQALIHASPLAIVILDGDLTVRLWSPAAERVLGFTADEVTGRAFPVRDEAERAEFARAVRAQIEGEAGPGAEARRTRRDGSTVDVSMWVAPLAAEDMDTVMVILADITARRRAREALRRRGEQLSILSRAAHQVNSVLQITTVMRTLVRSAMELCEGTAGMAGLVTDGHVAFDEYHRGERVRPIDLTFAVGYGVAGHVVKTARPYVANDPDDPVVAPEMKRRLGFTTCVTVPIFRRDGRVLGCFQVHDKTGGRPFDDEDVVLLEALAASAAIALENARLLVEREEADRAKDQFLATLSHELRTPLTAILGWTRMLRSGRLDASGQTTALETIERNTRLQTQLIEDLLDVSRIISGKLQLDRQPVELAAVVEAAVQSLQSVAGAKGVTLRLSRRDEGGLVEGDPHRLQQVVLNLLSNAIKFTPADGRVEVRLEHADDRARVVVSDTGQGIAPEVLPHVFDPFRQADGTHTKQHGGLGLGLAIVRHLVALHGGAVRAESEGRDRGATFTVELPLAGPLEREASRPRTRPGDGARGLFDCPPVLEGLRVLVVEDDPDARRFVAKVLEECKAEVAAAGSAAEALGMLARFRPHVLVSDIGMPRTDGYELMQAVRSRTPKEGGLTPALALTAYASTEDRARALAAGYQRHLAKPVDPADLVDAVADLADRLASIDEVRTMRA